MEKELVKKAIEARKNAYAPYSGFYVGAALLTLTGKVYTGCNVENASYGLTICAEQAAVAKAVSEGERGFSKIAVVGECDDYCIPCGGCLQVLAEFSPRMKVIAANTHAKFKVMELNKLIPIVFKYKQKFGEA